MPRLFATTVVITVFGAATALAQSTGVKAGADVITQSLVRKHVYVIADDSMLGRDTPSRGLEMTAQYVADNFNRVGLKPGGDPGRYLQRYQISKRKPDGKKSVVHFAVGPTEASASLMKDAIQLAGPRTGVPVTGPVVLVSGPVDSAAIARAELDGRVVLLVGSSKSQTSYQTLIALLARPVHAVIVISNRYATQFEQYVAAQFRADIILGADEPDGPVALEVHERALAAVLSAAHIDVTALRASTQPVFRDVPDLLVSAVLLNEKGPGFSAPNTVGILEGTDSVLKHEYVVFSAHMDHVGVSATAGKDSIYNGADDDGSGTAGVMALAEAFAKSPPKRSIIFLTVSGEEKGLWGSEWFTTHPPVPIHQIVADLNLDMIGRNWRDTIVVIGKEHSDLGTTLNRVNAAHPELGMNAIDDIWPQESFYTRSDHYNFAQRGVPILFFFNGTHPDYHAPSDSPDKIDAEKESRILKLIYWIGQEVGNAAERPKWNPESYKKIVKDR
jgi:Peptidase family M28